MSVALHGVTLELQAAEADFLAYAMRALVPLLVTSPEAPNIVSRLVWVDAPPSRDFGKVFGPLDWERRPDRDLYFAGSDAYWLRIDDFEELQMKISWSEQRLEITGYYHFQFGKHPRWERLRRIRHRRRRQALRERRFSTLVYYLIYHPLLWWLSRFRGWHVFHGGAVIFDGRAHVLAGLPGCGKSTLAVGALALPGFEIASDNLLLTDGRRVSACPEPVLLDPVSTSRVGIAASQLIESGDRRAFGRSAYQTRARPVLEGIETSAIYLVGRARRGSLERLDPDTAADRIEAGNLIAKEVRRCRIMSQVVDLIARTRTPDERSIMRSLAGSRPCFELWVAPDEKISDVVRDRLAGRK